jgi:hypothetical protein
MTIACPQGHLSLTEDYCDQCGLEIETADAPDNGIDASRVNSDSARGGSNHIRQVCPSCSSPRIGADQFCERCGHDFDVDHEPRPIPAIAEPPNWEVVITADKEYFDRHRAEDIAFPREFAPRRYLLTEKEVLIGRRSVTRNSAPDIDLSAPPEDPGVSRMHAMLIRTAEGYNLLDPGSTNGVLLNDSETRIPPNVPVPVGPGDNIHIGAWTTITISSRTLKEDSGSQYTTVR